MERQKAKAVLEAVLFTMGESVEIDRLAEVIEEDKKVTREILDEMAEDYRKEERGIELTTLDNAVQLCTKGEFYEYLLKIATTPKNLYSPIRCWKRCRLLPISSRLRGWKLKKCAVSAATMRSTDCWNLT